MYARLVLYTLGPGTRDKARRIRHQLSPFVKGLKGFKGVTFLGDHAVGEYGGLSLWETKADADAATAALKPKLQQTLAGIAKRPLTIRTFQVLEPPKA